MIKVFIERVWICAEEEERYLIVQVHGSLEKIFSIKKAISYDPSTFLFERPSGIKDPLFCYCLLRRNKDYGSQASLSFPDAAAWHHHRLCSLQPVGRSESLGIVDRVDGL